MKRRQGFTLVELLVSMALIIFIMAILSGAFQAALTTFRNLKAEGDMAEKLRAVTSLLQRDLAADHFEGKKRLSNPNFWLNGPPQQGFFQIYQGSPSYYWQVPPGQWSPYPPVLATVPTPPALRNFYDPPYPPTGIAQPTPMYTDTVGIYSYRSTDHALSFTVKLRGNQMSDFFSAYSPVGTGMASLSGSFGPAESRYQTSTSGGSYNYQWAAVEWFLQPQINPTTLTQDQTITDPTNSTSQNAQPLNLYTLYRRQALLVPDNSLVTTQAAANIGNFTELSCWVNGTNLYFNGPMDITVPTRRQWGGQGPYQAIPQGNALYGSDIQLNDVVSFDVRLLVQGVTNPTNTNDPFVTLWQSPFNTLNTATPAGINNGNTSYYPTNANGPMVFDTWTSLNDTVSPGTYASWMTAAQATSIPLWNPSWNTTGTPITTPGPIIQAIQISIRIWDYKTNQTRQVTMVQAL